LIDYDVQEGYRMVIIGIHGTNPEDTKLDLLLKILHVRCDNFKSMFDGVESVGIYVDMHHVVVI
jgi:hypothetical protein